ncbi:general vesicular transport factor p115 [Lasius niger]|uniref:General vesicular transport factor p115 n=2 Tax=Lasius TaxID=488720 RepID=A0A0J7NKV9_LASNI|nr:general vesicular transport factor p115 [Lasius niger]
MVADLENRLAEYVHMAQEHKEKNNEKKESELEYQLKISKMVDELEKLKKDQEDLLELLTDQDNKIMLYKERLIELGDKVESDESSGELDTDDQPESSN